MPRGKRKAHETGTSSIPSLDIRFPTEEHRLRFNSTVYAPMPSRYLDRNFFSRSCIPTTEVIHHYGLDKLVYCSTHPNIDRCSEFYNNLVRIDDSTYSTRVSGRDIFVSPSILSQHLELSSSQCTFVCFPSRELPFGDPYSHITLDTMHLYLFGQERTPTESLFRSTMLRIQDYVLYRVIVNCILPISTRDITMMRPFHTFLLYAFIHRLDLDIGLLLFHSIIYHSRFVTSGKVHMPYCHMVTSFLAALDIDVTTGDVRHLAEFDRIGFRNFKLAQIDLDDDSVLFWKRDRGRPAQPAAEEQMPDFDISDLDGLPALPPPPVPLTLEERLARFEEAVMARFDRAEQRQEERLTRFEETVMTRFERVEHRQEELLELFRRLHPPSD